MVNKLKRCALVMCTVEIWKICQGKPNCYVYLYNKEVVLLNRKIMNCFKKQNTLSIKMREITERGMRERNAIFVEIWLC